MMNSAVEIIIERMAKHGEKPAIYWGGEFVAYEKFVKMIVLWEQRLTSIGIDKGSICAVKGDYSPEICALFFALMKQKAVLVPFSKDAEKDIPTFLHIAGVEWLIAFDGKDDYFVERLSDVKRPALIDNFVKERNHPGLVVFSSGSTGVPKGILQDCENVAQKFVLQRPSWKTVLFLLMDHFGGFNTLLSAFAYGGVAVCVKSRMPDDVCSAIAATKADLLPTTPTFLNLLIASGCYRAYDLSSIKMITYGTEMMNETTLKKVKSIFSSAQIKQTYGLSELGVLRSKSEADGSVWLKVGGSEFQTKVIDNVLWIKAQSNMVGYLNAPNPFDSEGWFCTGDEVDVKEEYIKFMGRKTDVINVGGQKVFPAEVEAVLLQDSNVGEAAVFGQKHPIMGQIVVAKVSLQQAEDSKVMSIRLRKLCNEKLAKYKTPVKFEIVSESDQHNERFKKIRK